MFWIDRNRFLQENMFIIPVPFAKYLREMFSHCKEMLEYRNGYVAINPMHSKLSTTLRTAVEKGDGALDKEATSHIMTVLMPSGCP